MDTERTEWEADGPEIQAHYSFKGGQRGRYAHLSFQEADTVHRSVTDILAEAPGHLAFQTAEEVDALMDEDTDTSEIPPLTESDFARSEWRFPPSANTNSGTCA